MTVLVPFHPLSTQHHVWSIDPDEGLGLTDNSICTYSFMGNWRDIGTSMQSSMGRMRLCGLADTLCHQCHLGQLCITGYSVAVAK